MAVASTYLEGLAALDRCLVGLAGLLAVGGEGDLVALVLEHAAYHLHVELVVLDHEHAPRAPCRFLQGQ